MQELRQLAAITTFLALAGCYVQQPAPQGQQQQGYQQQGYQQQPGAAGTAQTGAPAQQGVPQNPGAKAYDPNVQEVFVNGAQVDQNTLMQLARFGLPIPSGTYWYDRVSGAFGQIGGPTALFIYPNLNLGGPITEDVSNGTSQVVINGRRLTNQEVAFLSQLIRAPIQPGRYWLDAQGNTGYEGGPAIANLLQLAARAGQGGAAGGGGGQSKIQRGWGGTYSSDGNCYYISTGSGSVMGPGC